MRVLGFFTFMVLTTHVIAQEAPAVAAESPAIGKQAQGSGDPKAKAWDSALPVKIIENPDQANHAAEREIKSDEHEASDLKAQQKAADAAERAAASSERQEDIAWWQMWLSVAGVVALVITIVFSMKSTNAAVKAADAALAANQIAAHTSQTQLRAWIGFVNLQIDRIAKPGAIEGFQFAFNWKNIGNTPANNSVALSGLANGAVFKNGEPDFASVENQGTAIAPSTDFSSGPIISVQMILLK